MACTLVTSQYCGCGHASVRVTSPRVTGEGGWSSVPGPHRYCHSAATRRNPRLQPLEKSYLLAGGWWLPPPGRVTQVQGQCPGRAGRGGGPGRGRRAAPSSRQLHGQQSSPPSDSVSGRAEPSQSLRTWARVRTWTLAV